MNKTIINSPEVQPASEDVIYLCASSLAAAGRYAEALKALCPDGKEPVTDRNLDLLARIVAASGDLERAQKLWQSAVKINPDNESAKQALAALNSSWLPVAAIKRITLLGGFALVSALAMVGALYLIQVINPPVREQVIRVEQSHRNLFPPAITEIAPPPKGQAPSGLDDGFKKELTIAREIISIQTAQIKNLSLKVESFQSDQQTFQKRVDDNFASLQSSLRDLSAGQNTNLASSNSNRSEVRTNSLPVAQPIPSIDKPVTKPANLPAPVLPAQFASACPKDAAWIISFKEGLFDRDVHFKIGAKARLAAVAKAIVQSREKVAIEVIGFGINEPPTWPWQTKKNDSELGQLRADAVALALKNLEIFPPAVIRTKSGQVSDTPYPAGSTHNKTVVLLISRSE